MTRLRSHLWSVVSSVRIRAFLSLGIIAGIGAVGTTAYWTDSATLTGGTFTSGSIDLTLDGQATGLNANYSATTFTVANLIPGESYAWAVKVANAGVTPLTYKATAVTNGGLGALNGLQFAVFDGATGASSPAGNTGTATAGNRTGDCSTGTPTPTQTFTPAATLETSKTIVPTARSLPGAASEWMCVLATLPIGTTNAFQGLSTIVTITFAANQVGVALP